MRTLVLAGLGVGLAFAGAAQAAPIDWTVDAGAAVRVRPAHIGSSQYLVDAVPIVEARLGEDLTISLDDGAKWRALKLRAFSAGPIVEYRQSFNDHLPRGAFRMHDTFEVGAFGEAETRLGLAEARLRHALGGYDGWSGDLSFSTGAPLTPRFAVAAQARASWADASFTEEYFGLRPHAAHRFELPELLDEDYITTGAEFDLTAKVTPRARAVLALTADRIVSELRPTPLLSSRNIFTAACGLTYRWSGGAGGDRP